MRLEGHNGVRLTIVFITRLEEIGLYPKSKCFKISQRICFEKFHSSFSVKNCCGKKSEEGGLIMD